MGHYTGFRIECVVKEQYRERLNDLLNWGYGGGPWEEFFPEDQFKPFTSLARAGSFPYGQVATIRDEPEPNFYDQITYDLDTGYLMFGMKIKNYEEELAKFIAYMAIPICREIQQAFFQGENRPTPTVYQGMEELRNYVTWAGFPPPISCERMNAPDAEEALERARSAF